jgi:hypothetical protein
MLAALALVAAPLAVAAYTDNYNLCVHSTALFALSYALLTLPEPSLFTISRAVLFSTSGNLPHTWQEGQTGYNDCGSTDSQSSMYVCPPLIRLSTPNAPSFTLRLRDFRRFFPPVTR